MFIPLALQLYIAHKTHRIRQVMVNLVVGDIASPTTDIPLSCPGNGVPATSQGSSRHRSTWRSPGCTMDPQCCGSWKPPWVKPYFAPRFHMWQCPENGQKWQCKEISASTIFTALYFKLIHLYTESPCESF